MKLFELIVADEEQEGVFALSLVSQPAIESHGIFFNRDDVKFAETQEEGLFVAPILIPDKTILRVDASGVPYEVYLSKSTVKKLAHMYLRNKYQDSFTIEHDHKVDNVVLVESWIADSSTKDKSKMYGLNVPAGTWMGLMAIDSEELREKFRSGEISAISIEGIFEHANRTPKERMQSALLMDMWAEYNMTEEVLLKDIDELNEEEAKALLNRIHSLLMPSVEMELPSVESSYPGEASGSISPATL